MAIPLLETLDIQGKDISADALLTQRALARYLVEDRQAHYFFTVKGNQSGLLDDLTLYFEKRQEPERVTVDCAHGRIETRKIWTTSALNEYLDFPHVGQAFVIERDTIEKKTGKRSQEPGLQGCNASGRYRMKSPTASPADPRHKPMPDGSWRSTAGTGPSRTAATTSWIGTMMNRDYRDVMLLGGTG